MYPQISPAPGGVCRLLDLSSSQAHEARAAVPLMLMGARSIARIAPATPFPRDSLARSSIAARIGDGQP
jgi:hypothetical protein